ncbi:PIN domain-containing protein [Protaetiibacter intestinalis]|uniref:PIN domain-containing protein n=1 Tax=Protaetiibacter intestinalis TaxID=2419774 RepID=A0A387B9E1_9MICO|nr:PIN domain-containing protein [Protaetiibacter intestinalis]AYF97785.1 PIN domain-containing protein [Protaetiibacter intestinalis]
MIGVDTNVILRHVLRDDAVQTPLATAFLGTLTRARPGFITHVVLAEVDWVLKRGYRVSREARLAVIRGLVETRELEFEDGESVVRALALADDGADFADALIAASGELFGVTDTVTFDRRASKKLGWRLVETAG